MCISQKMNAMEKEKALDLQGLFRELIVADNYFASNRNRNNRQDRLFWIVADNYFASNRN